MRRRVIKGMSGGGRIPGTLLQRLVGIPLRLWEDYRALVVGFVALLVITTVLIGLGHAMHMRPDERHIEQQDIPEILRPLVPGGRCSGD